MGKWSLAVCNLIILCALIVFSGCFAGADYENKMIYVYRITGPKVLQQFKVARSNKENSSPQVTQNADEIRAGAVVLGVGLEPGLVLGL